MVYVLMGIASFLTYGMFQNRQSLLGFPAGIFWVLAGAVSYQSSLVAWDIDFLIAFACLIGMMPLTVYGAYSFHSGSQAEKDEAAEFDDEDYFDEDSQTTKTRKVKKTKPGSDAKEDTKQTEKLFDMGGGKSDDDGLESESREENRPTSRKKSSKINWGAFR